MTIYKIKYTYKTGGTFGSSEQESILNYAWTSLEIAKENLVRIREHYLYYTAHESAYGNLDKNRRILQEAPSKPWYNEEYFFGLFLKQDDFKEILFIAPWCGYFESLYEAEIIEDTSDRKISFR